MEINNKKELFNNSKSVILLLSVGILVVLACLAIFLISQTYNTFSTKGDYPINAITLNGEGEVVAVPDVATFNYTVREISINVASAQTEATEKSNKIIEVLKQNEIKEEDIKTISYRIEPRYEWQSEFCIPGQPCRGGRNVLIGHEVSQTVEVKIRDITKAGGILSEIGGFEVSNVSGLRFSIDNEDVLKNEAREIAINDAMNKADELAKQLGIRIKGIINFHEDRDDYYPMGRGGDSFFETKDMMVQSAPEIPAGENIIKSRVHITFEIKG